MSKHSQTLQLAVSREALLLMCQEVFREFGWRVHEVTQSGMTAKEVASQLTSFTWPARIDIEVVATGANNSDLRVFGSITGVGPLQSNHLKGQVGRFLNSLSIRIDIAKDRDTPEIENERSESGLISDLRELTELHSKGQLSEAEFRVAKARLLGSE